jgi:xylulose-5-phosphate/fructose-6-phosphate phosphoketolase
MKRLFKQFSFPGGIPSHVAPETPGSIHEGGELGYALSHAFGAAFDNPDLIVACVVGDGEAETGPLATSWHSNKFLGPVTDGAVLPILHLNGYKIANPCVLARISQEELDHLFRGYGYTPYFVEGDEPEKMHRLMAGTLDAVIEEIRRIQSEARAPSSPALGKWGTGGAQRPRWPMIVLRTPKGGTCPKEIDGKRCEGYWRSHQVPMGEMHENPKHVKLLEQWMKAYKPQELFDATGRLKPELAALAPKGERRMSANPHGNGGILLRDLRLPDIRDYAVEVSAPGAATAEATRVMGTFLHDVMKLNLESRNFRLFSPDENNSNRWQDVLEVTDRAWMADIYPYDDQLAPGGRVMEMLSEHQCQGWLEGYLLTGRHGFFSCYEAFIHIIDSMFNQHAKWLKVCNQINWRRPIASLNYLLSSHVWRQDHNGFSHQDPGFIDHVVNKKAEVVRVYLPPDANSLLSVTDHCLRSRNYVNIVNLMKLQPASEHPHGLSDKEFDVLFTTDRPIIFAFHGYPWLIHRLTYRRANHNNLHVRGYKEEGTTTTPFDMCVLNDLDRFHLVEDVIDRVPNLGPRAAYAKQAIRDKFIEHKQYIAEHGEDMAEISNWTWGQRRPVTGRGSSTEADNV